MRLTTRGKLAVTAITDLALRSHGQPVALPSISARQGISLSHLEDIFGALRRAGLVRSSRGPGGGYTLARPAEQLSVAQIVQAAEAALSPPARKRSAAVAEAPDMTAELWTSFQSRVMDYLQSVSVADLVAQQAADPAALQRQDSTAVRRRAGTPARQLPAPDVPNSVFALGLSAS
ncbi:transcriptional regulator, BadM/Rrf2 family [Oryzisolibacter propanilivorax]|uniref:Transcriptional regulator, BadM/Rrf2 family n=1 Tax=Oryzisolibacter propanilivorax TaxID=1527607 RepID=A0A1G9P683_9BURK|nr:Rrf2 family transcriptional regulator [Oryzisolibacter propanilivorax]SDL94214.1 transcriptional regulator, BadM/Rrf2 family [Oryzisolibacter propanilivorax]